MDLAVLIPVILIPLLILALWRVNIRKLKEYDSKFGKIKVFKKYNCEKLLTIGVYEQGVSTEKESIKKSYWYKVAKETVKFCNGKKNPKVLMLGLGANTVSSLINKLNPKIHQTIVEIDKNIVLCCREFFELDKLTNYDLMIADAYKLFDQEKPLIVLLLISLQVNHLISPLKVINQAL